MIVCLGYRSIPAFANIRLSDGLAALNCASGISLRSFIGSSVLLDNASLLNRSALLGLPRGHCLL